MKPSNFHIFKVIAEAINIITSKESLKEFLTIPLHANALYLMGSMIITAVLGLVFWGVAARFYTATDVGFASAIISAATILALLSLLGFDFSLIRFLPQAEKPTKLINTAFTFGSLVSLFLAIIFVAGLNLWLPVLSFISESAICSIVFVLLVVVLTTNWLGDSVFIAQRQARLVLLRDSIFALLRIPLVILLALSFYSFGIVSAYGIAMAVALTLAIFLFLPKVLMSYKPLPSVDIGLIRDTWKYSGGTYAASLLQGAPYWVLPILVVNVLGPETNAYYYVTLMIACLLFAIPNSISRSLFAEGSHFEDKLQENATKSLKFTFMLLVPSAIIFFLLGKWILLFFGESYAINGIRLLWLLILTALPLGVVAIYATALRVTGRLGELISIWGFIAAAIILGGYLIMPSTGIMGVGYVWVIAHGLVALYVLCARKTILRR